MARREAGGVEAEPGSLASPQPDRAQLIGVRVDGRPGDAKQTGQRRCIDEPAGPLAAK
jgi:hypothetical protein